MMLDAGDLACIVGVILIATGLFFLFPYSLPFFLIAVGFALLIRGAYYIFKTRRPNRWAG